MSNPRTTCLFGLISSSLFPQSRDPGPSRIGCPRSSIVLRSIRLQRLRGEARWHWCVGRNAFVAVLAVTTLVGVHAAGVGSGKIAVRLSHRCFRDCARLRMRSSSHRCASTPVHAAWRAGDEAHKLQNRVKQQPLFGWVLDQHAKRRFLSGSRSSSFRALECSQHRCGDRPPPATRAMGFPGATAEEVETRNVEGRTREV